MRVETRACVVSRPRPPPSPLTPPFSLPSRSTAEEETYLNLVLEFIPDTVYKITRYYTKNRQLPPMLVVKLYVYQMLRSLAYLHSCGVCHRDIKPQNLLVDSRTHVLKLCDFGSAKALLPGEPSVAYICSRYYRAPELIFGSTEYTCAIDVWSSGCVAAELLLGHPLFPGDTGVDQLVEIIKVLGTPSREEVEAMNRAYTEFKFPQIRPYPWSKIFRPRAPPEAIDLISKMLQYVPTARLTAIEACAHEFFDELRDPTAKGDPSIKMPPNLFAFTDKVRRLRELPRLVLLLLLLLLLLPNTRRPCARGDAEPRPLAPSPPFSPFPPSTPFSRAGARGLLDRADREARPAPRPPAQLGTPGARTPLRRGRRVVLVLLVLGGGGGRGPWQRPEAPRGPCAGGHPLGRGGGRRGQRHLPLPHAHHVPGGRRHRAHRAGS